MNHAPETVCSRAQSRTNGHSAAGSAAVAPATPPFVTVQNRWLKRLRGQRVSIRLQSGEVIVGVLAGDDSYTLELQIPGHSETALVYKHSIEYLVPAGSP